MADSTPTFRVINLTEKRNVDTGLSLDHAHRTMQKMRATHKDSRYTVGPDVVPVVTS